MPDDANRIAESAERAAASESIRHHPARKFRDGRLDIEEFDQAPARNQIDRERTPHQPDATAVVTQATKMQRCHPARSERRIDCVTPNEE